MTKRDLSVEVARLYPHYSVHEVETMVNAVCNRSALSDQF
jgi:hypothetical protein